MTIKIYQSTIKTEEKTKRRETRTRNNNKSSQNKRQTQKEQKSFKSFARITSHPRRVTLSRHYQTIVLGASHILASFPFNYHHEGRIANIFSDKKKHKKPVVGAPEGQF